MDNLLAALYWAGAILGFIILVIIFSAIQDRIRWGFWPWQYTPEKMRRRVEGR